MKKDLKINKALYVFCQMKAWVMLGLVYMLLLPNPLFAQERALLEDTTLTMCRSHLVPVNLNDAIEVSLPAGTGKWYDASGNIIGNIVLPDGSQDLYSYYFLVEAKYALCELQEGDRFNVNIKMEDIGSPTGDPEQIFCYVPELPLKISELVVTGENIAWYDAPTAGNRLENTEILEDGKTYYATQLAVGCGESTERLAVHVTLDLEPRLQVESNINWVGSFNLETDLVVTDLHETVGETTFHTQEPSSALDMSNQIKNMDITESQEIYVMKATANGCFDVVKVTLVINNENRCNFELKIKDIRDVLCYGRNDGWIEVEMTDKSGENIAFTYLWSTGETTSKIEHLKAGNYELTVTPNNGCTPIDTTITIFQPDVLEILVDVLQHETGDRTKDGVAEAIVTGGTPAYEYQWSDGQTTARATQLAPGSYDVVVTDANGCEVSGTALIEGHLFIPDGFSPNGDNINEYFKITGLEKFPDAKLEVYNRWNSLVYAKDGYGNESRWGKEEAWWNGKSNKKKGTSTLPSDNYIYILTVNGKVYKGVVFVNW